MITAVVVKTGATAFGTTTSFKIMNGASLAIATTVATSLPTTVAFFVPTATATTVFPNVASGATLYWNAVQVDGGSATAATVDVLGYIY